jgi:hypothetical protein
MTRLLQWLFILVLVSNRSDAAQNAYSLVFIVATNGNDTWSGKMASPTTDKEDGPFLTIPRGLRAAREAKQKTPDATATIVIRAGTYYLAEPLILTPADSGLTLSAYRNERPVLSGGRRIAGWKEVTVEGRKLWAADVNEASQGKWQFRELWINGQRAVRARHPNKGYFKVAGLPDKLTEWTQGHTRFAFTEGDLKNCSTITNAEVVVMSRWVESRLPVVAIDDAQRTVSFSKRTVFELAEGDPYYIEGVLESLDAPGEWYLDSTMGRVYYQPRPSEQRETIEVIAPVLTQVLRIEGHPEEMKFLERCLFKGLTFSHSEWYFPTILQTGPNALRVSPAPTPEIGGFSQAAIGVPGAVWGEGVRLCAFANCSFSNLGNYAFELGRGCQSNRISHCEFSSLGAGGLKIGETTFRDNPVEQTRGNEISDCHIHEGGKMFHSAIGLWIGQSPENRINHNLIHDFYYTGISIGWTWGYGRAFASSNLVEFNHVHHIGVRSDGDGPILSDMAGIYTLGRQPGTRIINNLWHDIAAVRYGGWGIYFDEGSSGILAQSNVVYRTTHGGLHQHYGETNFIWNNIFAFARDQQIQRSRVEPHVSFSFETNIVFFDTGVLFGSEWADDKFKIDWNVYFDARKDAKLDGFRFDKATAEQWRTRGHDRNSIVSDPLFVSADKNNFQLRSNSPALKLGFRPIDLSGVGIRRGVAENKTP